MARWEHHLKPPFDPVCERLLHGERPVWALRGNTFRQMQSADEVRAQAIMLIARLNGSLRVQCGAEPLTMQAVARIDDAGKFHFHAFSGGRTQVRFMSISTLAPVDKDGNRIPPSLPKPSQAQTWHSISGRNADVRDMLVFTGRADNWFDIHKALELAQPLAGGRPG